MRHVEESREDRCSEISHVGLPARHRSAAATSEHEAAAQQLQGASARSQEKGRQRCGLRERNGQMHFHANL